MATADENKSVFHDATNWHAVINERMSEIEKEEFLKSYEGLSVEEKIDKLIRDFADYRFVWWR